MENNFLKFQLVRSDMSGDTPASNLSLNEKVKKLIVSGQNIAHFAFGQSPFPIPECMVKNLQKYAYVNSYLHMQGIPELREALVTFHKKYDGLNNLDADNFILAPGSKELIYLFMNIFNGTIMIPSPAWTTYEPQANFAGKDPLILETNKSLGWKVTPTIIETAMKYLGNKRRDGLKMLILTNPGNPTGTCYSEVEIQDLSEVCRRNNIIVLSDEIYGRLTFQRNVHCPMIKYYPEGTIMTSGFSKWASAGGWRLGYAYVPHQLKPLLNVVKSCVSHTFSCAPAPMQYAVAKTLTENSEELDEYIKDCSTILKWVGHFCHRELSSVGVTGHISEAGYYFTPDFEVIREGLNREGIFTSKQLADVMLTDIGVALMNGDAFLLPSDQLAFRFCFVCFDGSKALGDLKIMKEELKELQSFDEEFVRRNCEKVVEGINRLKIFVQKYKSI